MKAFFPSKEIERENEKIMRIWVNSENESMDEIIERYASPEYKRYIVNERNRKAEMYAQGMMA